MMESSIIVIAAIVVQKAFLPSAFTGMLHRSPRLCNRSKGAAFVARQASDPWVQRARKEGYICRSAFKLTEIDDRFRILKDVKCAVVDLGSSPGGWSQVVRRRIAPEMAVFGVDLLVMQARLPGVKFIQGDFSTLGVQRSLRESLQAEGVADKIDVVISDMCPNRGNGDRGRSAALNENALRFAVLNLRAGGHFVCKVLGDRSQFSGLTELANMHFTKVHQVRPEACRGESDESFLLAWGKLETPRDRRQIVAASALSAHGGSGAGKGSIQGNRVRPMAGVFGLDDWPGSSRRPR
jgi:23S rRNA (uridine2552-2'-O)-methyltransferase